MTVEERSHMFKQWTYISLIVGVIGAAAGFGIGIGRNGLQAEMTVRELAALKAQVEKNREDRITDRLLLVGVEKDINFAITLLEELKKKWRKINENYPHSTLTILDGVQIQ